MTITIYDPHEGHEFIAFKSNHSDFKKEYGTRILTTLHNQFTVMKDLAYWVNNDLKEECLFEVE